MATSFNTQLEELGNQLIQMGAMCEKAIDLATKALMTGDFDLAKQAIRTEKEINGAERDIEALCLRLLLHQHPVAKDLRLVSAAIKMITDMERIGDQAEDIAEIVLTGKATTTFGLPFERMTEIVSDMVTGSVDAFVRRDLAKACAVIEADDAADACFVEIKNGLIEKLAENPESGINMLMIAKYLERIGDHATNIAEWVEFSIIGIHRSGDVI